MIRSTYKAPLRATRVELNNTLGPKALQLAHAEAVMVIRQERAQWTAAMADSVGWDILKAIDWNNPALMHKDLKWIVKQYLNALCPKEK